MRALFMKIRSRANSFGKIIAALLLTILFTWPQCSASADQGAKVARVLVVMSYHPEYVSGLEIQQGIESVLTEADVKYFYLDTKNNFDNGPKKAAAAYALYEEFKPEVVIAADDNAQSLFVVPYLKDKVKTPVVFLGVNDDATKYGYPAANVTGILEKKHFREGISLAQLINPAVKRVAVIMKDSPSNRSNIEQIRKEQSTYPARITDFTQVTSLQETLETVSVLEKNNEALIILNLSGIHDRDGKSMEGTKAIANLVKNTSMLTIGASQWEIQAGTLCGVVKSMEEQGVLAAQMAEKILSGQSAIGDLPIIANRNGQRHINVTSAKRLQLNLKPMVLLGTQLIR